MSRTGIETAESSVSRFLETLPSKKPMLSSPVSDEHQLTAYRLRSEFAQTMLTSRQFTEAIQLLNEKTMNDIVDCDPLDKDRLTALKLKLDVITEFCDELSVMVDQWMQVQQIQDQHNRRQLYGEQDPYNGTTENVL